MKIYLATWMEEGQAEVLTLKDKRERLLSYFFIKQEKRFDIKDYVETGILNR